MTGRRRQNGWPAGGRDEEAFDGEEQPGKEGDRVEDRVAEPGEDAVELEEQAAGQRGRETEAEAAEEQRGPDAGDSLQQGMLDRLAVRQQQEQGRREQRGRLHLAEQGCAESFVVVPKRERPDRRSWAARTPRAKEVKPAFGSMVPEARQPS